MDSYLNIIKGLHPGKVIERELKKKGFTQRTLGKKSGIPFQTINAVIAGRRNLTTEQALKIENVLGYEEGFLAILQTYHDIILVKEKGFLYDFPEKPHIRRILFWDTDFDKINWGKHRKAVIKRVLEKGNHDEIKEIKRFYNLSANELKDLLPKKTRISSKTTVK